MKLKKKSLYTALVACAIVAGYSAPASANYAISNWQLSLPGNSVVSGINNLTFSGESYVVNTATSTPGIYTSTDTGVFIVTGYNGGLPLGTTGQLTGVFSATDITSLSSGSFVFTGGSFSLYYNPTVTYGTTSANSYGAASGTQLASFTINPTYDPTSGGGFINPLTGIPNGQVSVGSQAPTTIVSPSPFLDTSGNALGLSGLVLGVVTSNAALDSSANSGSYTLSPLLSTALSGSAGTTNNAPNVMFIGNGGQLTLQYAPEPATIALLGCGLLGIGWSLRRKMSA